MATLKHFVGYFVTAGNDWNGGERDRGNDIKQRRT